MTQAERGRNTGHAGPQTARTPRRQTAAPGTAESPEARVRAARVRLLALDVDGTLTSGQLFIGPTGEAMKAFSVRDGFGLRLLREAGVHLAIVTARNSAIVRTRAAELRIETLHQGAADKAQVLRELSREHGLDLVECAFAGDDWPDLAAMTIAGFAAAATDAAAEVRACAHWVSTLPAGQGAMRELAEFILRAKGRFEPALLGYRGGGNR